MTTLGAIIALVAMCVTWPGSGNGYYLLANSSPPPVTDSKGNMPLPTVPLPRLEADQPSSANEHTRLAGRKVRVLKGQKPHPEHGQLAATTAESGGVMTPGCEQMQFYRRCP